MAGEGRYALLYVPEHGAGMSTYLRIGATADDDARWRDFTDGNRVTTTRGDKVEVIGGTYEMVVLGRHELDVDVDQGGWNAKDGEVHENGKTYHGKSSPMASSKVSVVWGPRGTKALKEETVKGDVETTYHGDSIEQCYGERIESYTGNEVLPVIEGIQMENPEIIDRTWAKSIASYTGSAALPVPSITTAIWATTMESETHARSMTDTTLAGSVTSTTNVTGQITTVTRANAINDTTTVTETKESESKAQKFLSTTHADTENNTYGNTNSYSKGNSHTTVDGIETTINLGVVNEVVLGAMIDTTVGATAGLKVGGSVDVSIAAEATLGLSAKLEVGNKVELGPAEVKAFLGRMQLALANKSLALVHLL